jgi:VCBS repeat-containing protein
MNKLVRIGSGAQDSPQGPTSTEDDFYPLEERILFDGAAAAEAADDLQDSNDDAAVADEIAAQQAQEQAAEALALATIEMPEVQGNEIYFVDAGIENADSIIAAIPDGAEVILLDANTDGVEQIAAVLQGRNGIDAIHILSHGQPGELQLGNASLDSASIDGIYADELSAIGAALSENADILIYGCDFGQDEATLAALADATGADVAASNDDTGAADLGGNWNLEIASGEIQASALVAEGFEGLLAPPEVTIPDAGLAVTEDTDVTISGVSVADADGDPLNVSLNVGNGTITLSQTANLTVSGDGSATVTLSGSEADINAALEGMIYSPDSNYNGADTLDIVVDDGGIAVNESVGIQIASVNDAPTLAPTNATVLEGGTVTLTEAHFGLNDPDLDVALNTNPQLANQIVFKIATSNLTDAGLVQLNGAALLGGSTFSLQDVIDGNLTYVHGNSDVTPGDTDDFAVTVNDGGGSGDIGPAVITIDLQPANQAPTIGGTPSVFEGQGTEDEFGNPGVVTETADIGASLSIGDRDDAVADSQITITNIDNAGEGVLFWDADGDGQLDAGEALTGGETFAATELASGRLRFAHDGTEVDATSPSFDIEVTDAGGGAGSGNALSSGPQTIEIAVNPNNDNPELTINTPITVPSGTSLVIDDTSLQVTDPDNAIGSISYVVTEVPTRGELRINGEVIGVGGRFTQADIDAGLIDYNSTSQAVDGDIDTFNFEVRDGTLRAFNDPGVEGADRNPDGTVAEHTFTINLSGDLLVGTPPDGPAPGRSGIVEIASSTITGVLVTEADGVAGGVDTVVITPTELEINLQTSDGSGGTLAVPADETTFRITAAPTNGTLLLAGSALGTFGTFTQADVNAGDLTFVHDGSEAHQGSFEFSVSGGTGAAFDGTFTLEATPTNDAPTVGTTDLPLIPEGATIRVTSLYISVGDVDTDNEPDENGGTSDPNAEAVVDDLMFRFTDLPDNGTLERFDGANWVAVTTDDLLSSTLLTTSADGEISGLRYIHDGSEIHDDSFSMQVRDDLTSPGTFGSLSETTEGAAAVGNISTIGTVNVTMAGQNDAPIAPENFSGADSTITDSDGNSQTTANVLLTTSEGAISVIDSTMLTAVDTDNTDPSTLQYRLTQIPENGLLTLNGNLLGVGSTFTQADINNGLLSYEHDGSEIFADQFLFIVSDSVADHVFSPDGTGGASTFNIVIDSARNDRPEIESNGASSIDLFGTYSHDFGTDLTIIDSDIDDGLIVAGAGESDFVQVTVALTDSGGGNVDLSSSGGITLGSTTGLTLTDADDSDGTLVFQGAFADVQAALTNLNVELENVDHNDVFTFDVTVDDRLRDASGALTSGANGDDDGTTNADDTSINDTNNRDTISVTFRASDDNDDPTITAIPGDQTVNEDTVLDLSGYVIGDVDAFDSVLTVDLAVSNGHLSVTGNATTGDPSSLTLTGTATEINAALAQLTYIADQHFHSPNNVSNNIDDDTLTITINDGGSNGSGGGADVIGTPTNIAINPVNDGPSVTVPGTQTLASGTSITFSGANAPTVSDAADSDNTPFVDIQQLTVSVPAGMGTLTGSGVLGLVDLDGSAETLVFIGTLAELNAALDGLTFEPTESNFDGTVPITVELNDMANGGTALPNGVGGALIASDTFDVQISSINDGPTVTPPVVQSVNEDASLTFSTINGNVFTVSDPDDFGTDMVATVTVDYGVVTAATGSGATLSGDGTGALIITGTESEINNALNGLVYTPNADFHTSGVAGDTISVTLDDQGNTGTEGPKSDSASAVINVISVNDRPTATGGPVTVTVPGEDQPSITGTTLATLLAGNYSDATDDQTPTGGNTSTAVSFVAITGSTNYDTTQGTWQVSDGSGGWIDVPATGLSASNALIVDASQAIRFVPAADFHGTPGTLNVRLADGDSIDTISASTGAGDLKNLASEGGTDETGRWSADSIVVQTTVANENDRPSASDTTLTAVDEDNATSTGQTVGNLFSSVFDDSTDDQSSIIGGADASTTLGGIAIIGSAADAATEGTWQYSIDNGATWTDIPQGANEDTDAILLPTEARLRFVPVADFNGTPGALGVRLADSTQTFSADTDISSVVGDDSTRNSDIWSTAVNLNTSVTPRNDAPVLGGTGSSATVNESTSPNSGTDPEQLVTGASVSDPDIVTTTAVSQFGAGTITVSLDDGGQSFDQLTITDGSLAGIASVSGGTNGNDLVVQLSPTATTAQVATIVEALRYNSSSDTFGGARDMTVTLSDGNNDNGGGNNAGGPSALTDSLSASITINEQNDAPDASDSSVIAIEDSTYIFMVADFNYAQPGGEADAMDGVRIDALPGVGTLQLNGIAISSGDIIAQSDIVAGNLTYVPPADENGAAFESFTFSVRDSRGAFDATANTMVVNVLPVNDPPSAIPSQNFVIGEDDGAQTVSGFMQSVEEGGGPDENLQTVTLNVESVTDGALFTAAELFDILPNFTDATDSDNTLTFTASDILAEGETETVTVTVGVTDNGGTDNGGNDTGTDQTFTITITGVNDAPVLDTAQPDQSNIDGETITPVDISGNFSDVDASDTLTFTATGLPPGLTLDPDTGVISGTLDIDASTGGPYSVTVTANDGSGTATATQSDTFIWTVANPVPVAQDDTDTTDEDTAISRDAANGVILPNDSDPDGDTLSVDQVAGLAGNLGTAVPGSAGGTFTINADGSYDFDPDGAFEDLAPGESRTTSVGYRITDGEGGTDTATLTVTVTGVNDAPVLDTAQPDQSNIDGETITPVDISGNFSDVDASDTLTFTATGLPPGLTLDPDTGVISGTLDIDASTGGPYSVTVTANDGSGTATATQSDTFTWAVNSPPSVAPGDTSPIPDIPEPDRQPLIVDHIVSETANTVGSLHSITPLLSGLNTALGVKQPILTALNGLQSLDGTSPLSATDGDVFAGIDAAGPILQAVGDVGFKPLVDQHDLFGQGFPEGAPNIDTVLTRSGFLIRFAILEDGEVPEFYAEVLSPRGEPEPIQRVVFETADGEINDEISSVMATRALEPFQANFELETGHVIGIEIYLNFDAGDTSLTKVDSVGMATFSDQTERYAQSKEYETARLMQAIRGS